MKSNNIINRVSNSKLKMIDLDELYPTNERILFDVSDWLFEKIVLKEDDFRNYVSNFDWTKLNDKFVAIHCSKDVIIPKWAYLLISVYLSHNVKKFVIGSLETLEICIWNDIINKIDFKDYKDFPVIIKGCSKGVIPDSAYSLFINKLVHQASSISFGEACSSVPLYKKRQWVK